DRRRRGRDRAVDLDAGPAPRATGQRRARRPQPEPLSGAPRGRLAALPIPVGPGGASATMTPDAGALAPRRASGRLINGLNRTPSMAVDNYRNATEWAALGGVAALLLAIFIVDL